MKKCYKVKKLFGPYIYNIAENEERDIVENHIKICRKCADDLRTRQNILKRAEPTLLSYNQTAIQDERFAENVYKRLALEVLNHRSRQIFIQRYILRPSFALAIIIIGIMFSISRLNSPILVKSTEVRIPTAKEIRLHEQKTYAQAKITDSKSVPNAKKSYAIPNEPLEKQSADDYSDNMEKSDITADVIQSDDPMERLVDANMINYSLGDKRRAMAEYQRIIDDYPDTNAASQARNLLKLIMESEMRISEEYVGKPIDKGI